MPINQLSFAPLSAITASNDWALTSDSGAGLVGGTMSLSPDITITSIMVEDDDPDFEDDDNADGFEDNGDPQLLTEDVTIDGVTYPTGTPAEAEYAVTLTNPDTGDTYEVIAIKLGSAVVGFTSIGSIPPAGVTYNVTSNRDSVANPDGTYDPILAPYDDIVPCFTSGTLIATERGNIPVEQLRVGDKVVTADAGPQPIRWLGGRRLDGVRLARAPHLRPVRIRAGALGAGTPARDLVVSPQHRILVSSELAQRLFGQREVLVAAKHLLGCEGIEIVEDGAAVTYWHVLCDSHQVVFANGAATESLYTGPEALKAIGSEALAEILEIFPDLAEQDQKPIPARHLINGREGRALAAQSRKHEQPLIATQAPAA